MKLSFILLLCSLSFLIAWGESNNSELPVNEDNSYIEKLNQQLTLKLAVTNNTDYFQIVQQDLEYTLKPNTSIKTNLILSYRAIRLGLGYSPDFIPGNNDELQKGSSKILWAGTDLNLRRWKQHFEYIKIKGFYSQNSSEFNGIGDNNFPFIQFPELNYTKFAGYTALKLNPNFSFSAFETQTERQLKSTGSFVPALVYRYYIVDNKIKITPTNSSQKSNNLSTSVQLGYFHTWVVDERFFITTGIATGLGLIHSKVLTRFYLNNYETKTNYVVFRAESMIAVGYNAKYFFAGLQCLGKLEEYKQQKTTTTLNENFQFQLYAGYRFDAPVILSKLFNKK